MDTREEKKEFNNVVLQTPSQFSLRQVVKLNFKRNSIEIDPQYATVKGIHFYEGKVKYDLGLWLGDGSVDNPETESRIYNVDSIFLSPV